MQTYDCAYCGLTLANSEELLRHMIQAVHPTTPPPSRPLLMVPKSMTTTIWACNRCNDFTTENEAEANMHDDACANPPTMREVETAAAKLVKMEAELAQSDVGEDRG